MKYDVQNVALLLDSYQPIFFIYLDLDFNLPFIITLIPLTNKHLTLTTYHLGFFIILYISFNNSFLPIHRERFGGLDIPQGKPAMVQTLKQTDTQTNITTYRLNRPNGRWVELLIGQKSFSLIYWKLNIFWVLAIKYKYVLSSKLGMQSLGVIILTE